MTTVQMARQDDLAAMQAQVAATLAAASRAEILALAQSGVIKDGEATLARIGAAANFTPVANNTHLTYFTAGATETITKIRVANRNTAGAGITDSRLGVYEYNPVTDQVTLLTSTVNDITLFNAAFKISTVTLPTPVQKVAGKTYAIALRVTATTMPNFFGRQAELGQGSRPPLNGYTFGTDFPAGPIAAPTGVSGATFNLYYELLR